MERDLAERSAMFWAAGEDGAVNCRLCAHYCRITPGRRGICGVRENRGGELFTLVYGRLVARNLDPVEKKPLYHFLPGTLTYSIATVGCNMDCANCQNYSISQAPKVSREFPGVFAEPGEVVDEALASGARSISYTYTEPTIFLEYALDVMKLAKSAGLKNIFVTNGFMGPDPLKAVEGLLDAANVDLKALSPEFYRANCKAKVEPVMETIRAMRAMGVWVEVTTLVIPGLNDSDEELRRVADFVVSVGRDVPWHVSGFHPTYKLPHTPPTTAEALGRARDIGLAAGLDFVYEGNRPGTGGEDTVCSSCGKVVITRRGFRVTSYDLDGGGACSSCGAPLPGRFRQGG